MTVVLAMQQLLPVLMQASFWIMSSSSSSRRHKQLACSSSHLIVAACLHEIHRSMHGSRDKQQTQQFGRRAQAYQSDSNGGRSYACSNSTMRSRMHAKLLWQADVLLSGMLQPMVARQADGVAVAVQVAAGAIAAALAAVAGVQTPSRAAQHCRHCMQRSVVQAAQEMLQ
jgi:hypothetical protein